jgi:hypothetical protein
LSKRRQRMVSRSFAVQVRKTHCPPQEHNRRGTGSVTFEHHFQNKACASNCFVLSKSPTPLHSCSEQARYVCHSRRKLSTAPSGRGNGSSNWPFFRRLERDHGFPQSWSSSRLRNCRRPGRRRVPLIPLLRRPAWCRQQWQRLEYHYKGACHSEFTVDYMDARDTAGNSTGPSRTFVMMAPQGVTQALRRGRHSHGDVHGKERCCRCGGGKEEYSRVPIERWHQPHGRPMRSATGSKAMKALKRGSLRPRFR